MSDFESKMKLLKKRWKAAGHEVQSVNNYAIKTQTDPSSVVEFKARFRIIEKYYSKFEELTDELDSAYEVEDTSEQFPSKTEQAIIDSVRKYYLDSHLQMEILSTVKSTEPSTQASTSFANTTANARTSNHLPKLTLPKFDGDLIHWPKFRDMFVSMVHKDDNISPMEKFHYLVSSLSGNARSVISHLPIEDANYNLAWKALNDSFNNIRMLSAAYLNQILLFKPIQGKATVSSLKLFLASISDNVAAFQLLKIENESNFILFHLAARCLDQQTRELFEITLRPDEIPTIEKLTKFIRERSIALQLAENNLSFQHLSSSPSTSFGNNSNRKQTYSFKTSNSSSKASLLTSSKKPSSTSSNRHSTTTNITHNNKMTNCAICKGTCAGILNCPLFYSSTVKERLTLLNHWRGCKNCLNDTHSTSKCTSKWHCRFCKLRHNSMLCLKFLDPNSNSSTKPDPLQSVTSTDNFDPNVSLATYDVNETQVILGTAYAEILDARGIFQRVRLVVDSASQYSYITQRCLNRLGLQMKKVTRNISCLGGTMYDGAKGVVSCTLRPNHTRSINLVTEAVVIKNITSFLPNLPIPPKIWRKYLSYELADPKFFEPSSIDFLVGADLFSDVLTGSIEAVGENMPKLFSSIFGFIVIGKYNAPQQSATPTSLFSMKGGDSLNFELEKFWKIEDVCDANPQNPDEVLAEEFFKNTHYRLPCGRYTIRLPFKDPDHIPDLSASSSISLKRFHNLEIKLRRNPDLQDQYCEFMKEYVDLDHMEPTSNKSKYVIPHHCVTKEDRNQLKLRVVFDASCTTLNGSLNEHLLIGEPLQNDIRNILINFRAHNIVFVTDAVKMYRQIVVDPLDRPYQHIYWRFSPNDSLQLYELKTLTYGLGCAPHIALRVLNQLCEDERSNFPLASKVLSRDVYIDDLATGSDSIESAITLQRQVIGLMERGGFSLSKWASNSQELLDNIPADLKNESSVELSLKDDGSLKILGLQWDPQKDVFSFKIKPPEKLTYTKRAILSTVARIFDPIGFLSPSILLMKGFIQELWKENLGWDQALPQRLISSWTELMVQIPLLSHVEIPRFIAKEKPYGYQIVGFCDASNKGYCASIYVRITKDSKTSVNLLTAKTKLAPVKSITCPRLELCGAHLLAKLYRSLSKFFQILPGTMQTPMFFTDSSIVLGWINTPPFKLKVFVANRVTEIIDITSTTTWHHIDGKWNPSDCGSRGILPKDLIHHDLWWKGPPWLSKPITEWPHSPIQYIKDLPELKKENCVQISLTSSAPHCLTDWMLRFSSYNKLLRVTALIIRTIHNRKPNSSKITGPLTLSEIHTAFINCVKLVQLDGFLNGSLKHLPVVMTKYASLKPFLDSNDLLRVGGRLENANITPSHKHQILLPAKSHFSTLLIDFYHRAYLHPGPNALQALLQTRFWIPSMRRLVRQRTFMCLKCYKSKAKAVIPCMGDLPDFRLKEGRAFMHVGIDFAGPFLMKESNRRKARVDKVYLCLFICMVTKAMHLEAVTSLSSESFLASFSRFISRRGLPVAVYTDCGSNFIGASKELKMLEKWYTDKGTTEEILAFANKNSIKWFFNPPYSPHFGGLWEAGVKSVKRHLKLVAGDTPMTYEEISTLFAKIEAVLNSRPLCPLSNDPTESDFLSPGHFLIGAPLLSNPEPTLLDTRINRLSRWQLVKQLSEEVWNRWRMEYLSTLQARSKWTKSAVNLKYGDLVLLKVNNVPPLQWPMGRIVETKPGKDGTVRVVSIKTPTSIYSRTVANVVPLLPLQSQPYES